MPIVDIGQNPVVNAGDIYSGMYARVCVSFYAYNFSGKRGIGCGLEAVQKLEDGEPLGGHVSAADAFGGANAYAGAATPAASAPVQPQGYAQLMQSPYAGQYPQAAPASQYTAVDPITGQPIYGA